MRAAAEDAGGVAELARRIGMAPNHLRQWLREPARGLRPVNLERLRRGLGIPTAALVHRHEPVGRVVRREGSGC